MSNVGSRAPPDIARRMSPATRESRNVMPVPTLPLGDDELVQLVESLAHSTRAPRGDGSVESFLRGIEVGEDQQRLASPFLEGGRGDGPTVIAFVIGPDEARVRCHFDVPTEELHGLRALVAEHQPIRASDTNVQLAGKHRQAKRLRS